MQEHFLESRGIYYRANELQPSRTTLLFIHGLSGSSSVWLPFETLLASRYNIVSFDLRGHGKSKKYKKYAEYELHEFTEDTYALLTHLNVKKCVVVSHSLGALVALELLHEHPELFSKAVFISPAAETGRLSFFHLRHPLNFLSGLSGFLLSFFTKAKQQTDYARFRNNGDWDIERIRADVANTGQRTYLYSLNHLYRFPHEKWWGDITVPTLIMHGTKDTMVPVAYATQLSKQVPNAQLIVFQNKNHLLPLNSINEVAQAIEDFIQ